MGVDDFPEEAQYDASLRIQEQDARIAELEAALRDITTRFKKWHGAVDSPLACPTCIAIHKAEEVLRG